MLVGPEERGPLLDPFAAIAQGAPSVPATGAQPALVFGANRLGRQFVGQLAGWGDRLVAETAAAADALSDLPLLWRRVERGGASPALQKAALTAIWQLALVIGCALLAGWLAGLALRRPFAGLAVYAPGNGVGDDGGGIAATTAPPSARARR